MIADQRAKIKDQKYRLKIRNLILCALIFFFCRVSFAQPTDDIEITIDAASSTIPLPKIFTPNINLSGRGFNHEVTWPQGLAAKEAMEAWKKDIGFSGMYRLQYDLWEAHQLVKDKDLQDKLLANYEAVIKDVSDSGGTVILDLFGTPAGLGKILDKKSPPRDLKVYKGLVKKIIRDLSCDKRYNIWYEVWTAPDLDDFFLGRRQEYLAMYRVVAECVKELRSEYKINIPLGGPGVSWWFQNVDGNTVLYPERSLLYELIKFCYHYRLPLDFVSWHGYSSDPSAENEQTIYRKNSVKLIRDWLSYFNFDKNTSLIVEEWNYDRNANVLSGRGENSNVAASYALSRIKKMWESGIDIQLYFSLEDFKDHKAGVVRNVGAFYYDGEYTGYKGGPKAVYNAMRMLTLLEKNMLAQKSSDDFAGVVITKNEDSLQVIGYNYIDPEIAQGVLSRNIAGLNASDRKVLLAMISSKKLEKILSRQIELAGLKLSAPLKLLLTKALEAKDRADKFQKEPRKLKLNFKNLKGNYAYKRYTIDASCGQGCTFAPAEEKDIDIPGQYQQELTLAPYSAQMVTLKLNPPQEVKPAEQEGIPANGTIESNATNTTQ